MIARHWRGWTKPANADAYERLLRDNVLPGLKKIKGYCGGYVLRRNAQDETEFVVINLFESPEAVRQFAGPDYDVPVFELKLANCFRRLSRLPGTMTCALARFRRHAISARLCRRRESMTDA